MIDWVVSHLLRDLTVTRASCFKVNVPLCVSSSKHSHWPCCFHKWWRCSRKPCRGRLPNLGLQLSELEALDPSPSSNYPASKKMLQQHKMNLGTEFPGHTVTLHLTKNWKIFSKLAALFSVLAHSVPKSQLPPRCHEHSFRSENLSIDFEFNKQIVVTCRDNAAILCPVSKGLLPGSVLSGLLLVTRHSLERAPCPVCSSPRQMPHNSGTSNTLSSPTPLRLISTVPLNEWHLASAATPSRKIP